MPTDLFDRVRVIDVDTHLTEPPDVWTGRTPRGGVCHRFAALKLVSVESGAGWIPAARETFDWQWRNGGVSGPRPSGPTSRR